MHSLRLLFCLAQLLCLTALHAQTRFDYFLLEAERLRTNGQFSSATELYQHCLELRPEAPEANYGMAIMQMLLRNDSIGISLLERACAVDSCNPWYLTTLATVYLEDRNVEAVVPVLERLARIKPRRNDVHEQLAYLYHTQGDTEKAIESLNHIEMNDGVSVNLSVEKARMYLHIGDSAKAFNEMQALCDEYPYDMNCFVLSGNIHDEAGDTAQALALYRYVQEREPSNEYMQQALLRHLISCGKQDEYRHARDSILFSSQTSSSMRITVTRAFLSDARHDSLSYHQVLAVLDSMLMLTQNDVSLLELKAGYQASTDSCDEKEFNQTMKDILEVEPNHKLALEQLLTYYGRNDSLAALEDICRKGVNYYPESLPYHYYLGIALVQQNKQDDAKNILRQGLNSRDEEATELLISDVFSLLGDITYAPLHEAEAFACYDSALVYNPDNVPVLNNYAYYLSLHYMRLDEAEEMSYRTVRAEPKNKTYLDTYAWILFIKDDFTGAKHYIDQVVDPAAEDKDILENLEFSGVVLEHAGDIYARNGQMEQAIRYWKLALKKDSTGTELLKRKVKEKRYIK